VVHTNRAAIASLCSSVDAADSSVPTWSGDANMTAESTANSQWVFPISALSCTPTAQERSLHEEMYDRSRGIEFLYRLGTSIGLFVRPTLSTPVSVDMLNQPLSLPQPFPWPIHGCDVVPSLLYAVFYARLSSPSQSLSQLLSGPSHSSLIRHQTIAAACVFLATKTEECGRKLRDVARVCQSKAKGIDVRDIPESGPVRFLSLSFS
jgi:cyclin K